MGEYRESLVSSADIARARGWSLGAGEDERGEEGVSSGSEI